jgi:hypothetical protein
MSDDYRDVKDDRADYASLEEQQERLRRLLEALPKGQGLVVGRDKKAGSIGPDDEAGQ